MNCTPNAKAIEELSERMASCVQGITQRLGEAALSEGYTLAELEEQVLQQMQVVGNEMLSGLCGLSAPVYAAETVTCGCGGEARYQRRRVGASKTLLGVIEVKRPYYLCGRCHQGHCPLDAALGFCAGGVSAGLSALMALLGVQFPFAEAAEMLAKLTLVQVSPNACRQATESLGALVAQAEEAAVAQAWADEEAVLPAVQDAIAGTLYVSMDGVTVHIEGEGWKNQWLGAVYTTRTSSPSKRPEQLTIRTERASFYSDLGAIEPFGRQLWLEATRRGLADAQQVVVIGDGAHWIWHLAQEHFPAATQILDWYHAASYVWRVADALYGQQTDFAKHWAKQQLDLLWDGNVQAVMLSLEALADLKPAAREALTYFHNNHTRMRYDLYRTQGLQIGSGTIESGCKHVIGARLKQAGMIWSRNGARFVAKLRTRLKSRRWPQTLALRSPPARAYVRTAA